MKNKYTSIQIAFKLQQMEAIKRAMHCISQERDYDDLSEAEKSHSGDLYNVAAIFGYSLKDSLDVIDDQEVKDEVMHLIKRYEKWVAPTCQVNRVNDGEELIANKLTFFQVDCKLQQMGIMIMAARYIIKDRDFGDLTQHEQDVCGGLYDVGAILAYSLKDYFDVIEDKYKPDILNFIKRYERYILPSLQPNEDV